MGKVISAIIGFFGGAKLGSSDPKGLLVASVVVEVITLLLSFSGNPLGGITAVITGFLVMTLGVRYGGGPGRCIACAFFQFFFVLGILVAPGSAGAYLLLHLACLAYPICKALF